MINRTKKWGGHSARALNALYDMDVQSCLPRYRDTDGKKLSRTSATTTSTDDDVRPSPLPFFPARAGKCVITIYVHKYIFFLFCSRPAPYTHTRACAHILTCTYSQTHTHTHTHMHVYMLYTRVLTHR